ncbi:polyprenol monophosphomannose synthase [Streptomyces sp. NPDC029526]|uniref:polyprenol monophosphomannose synthase n=1 Tax=Streptomyces sp. NPDC029526 TaxID=3155728 RepID=UPI0033C52B22
MNDGDGILAAGAQARTFGPLGTALVIIPTYNEAENIKAIVRRVRAAVPEAHVLVADDNSPDGTGKLADELAAEDDLVQVLHRTGKEGLGAAYLAGFRWGMEHGYGVLIEMDADGSHQPEELPRLLTALKGADLVLGSRWVPGGRVVNWPRSREIISRGGSLYSRVALDLPLRDITGGFRAFRTETLKGLGLDEVASQGYCFQVDLARRAVKAGYHVVEVPITFVERELGDSKMSRDILVEALWRVTAWGVGERVGKVLGRTDGRAGDPRPGGGPAGDGRATADAVAGSPRADDGPATSASAADGEAGDGPAADGTVAGGGEGDGAVASGRDSGA